MVRLSLVTGVLGVGLLFGTLAHAQQQPSSPPPPPPGYGTPITLEQARAAIAAGQAESKKNGWNHVFAVVEGLGKRV
jgi:glc operon protein GlcG